MNNLFIHNNLIILLKFYIIFRMDFYIYILKILKYSQIFKKSPFINEQFQKKTE